MPTEIRIISHSNVFYDLFSGLLGPLLELVRGLDCFKDLRRAPNPSRCNNDGILVVAHRPG